MSSSISSSDDRGRRGAAAWSAFLGALGARRGRCCSRLLIAVDPYDSGRSACFGIEGVDDASPRTANASRARDPQFDSAIIGNSTGQLLKPADCRESTGLRFVQLTVAGRQSARAARRAGFLPAASSARRRAGVRDRSIPGASTSRALPRNTRFPFWLYGEEHARFCGRLFFAGARSSMRCSASRSVSACASATTPDGFCRLRGHLAARAIPPDDRAREIRPAGARAVSDDFPGRRAARCGDQETAGRCCRRAARAADLLHDAAAGPAVSRQPSGRPATRRCARSSPAGRTATSSTTASTMR